MNTQKISFIGGGNMAHSLIGGLLQNGVSSNKIRVADINPQPPASRDFPIQVLTDNVAAVVGADVVVLAVKPQMMAQICQEIAAKMPSPAPLFISIAAGIRLEALSRWLGESVPIVRVMPNTPALVQSGASALYAADNVSNAQKTLSENILRAVGLTVWLEDEKQMDAVTALSGSGPAYFFLVMEMLQNAAEDLGIKPETARLLTLQTAFGAAKMALESQEDAATLRARVTSKGGTTEQAVNSLLASDFQNSWNKALQAAARRSESMAEELGSTVV